MKSLVDILKKQAKSRVKRGFFDPVSEAYEVINYQDLISQSFTVGHKLYEKIGLKTSVIIVCATTPYSTLIGFYGAISAGYTPLIFPSPKALGNDKDYYKRILELSEQVGFNCHYLCDETLSLSCEILLSEKMMDFKLPCKPEVGWENSINPVLSDSPTPDQVAFLQLSGGSTGTGKIIGITHANVIDNALAISKYTYCTSADIGVSWLPLYHDMGLVGAELFSLVNNYPLYLLSPFDFLKKPLRWLKTISDYQCTLSPSPNFAYDYCFNRIIESDLKDINLSTWRIAFNGAEPIKLETLINFTQKFSKVGFTSKAFLSCYGMSEATLAVSFTEPGKSLRILSLKHGTIKMGEKIVFENDRKLEDLKEVEIGIHISSVGKPLSNFKISITNSDKENVNDDLIAGEITITGNSVAKGYLKKYPDKYQSLNPLYTGDIGFLYDGELFVIDRIKNTIIRNGQNYFAGSIENEIGRYLKLSSDKIVVFQSNLFSNSEIIAVAEVPKNTNFSFLREQMNKFTSNTGICVDRVIFTRSGNLPRTTSGKKKHYLAKQMHETQILDSLYEIDNTSHQIVKEKAAW